jgi:HK97 family phage portal protein
MLNAKSGVIVNIDTALRVSTVLACARVIAEGCAQLPMQFFERSGDGKSKTPYTGPEVDVLTRAPNDWMTPFEVKEQMTIHAVLSGNAYAYLGRAGNKLVEIIPLTPGNVSVYRHVDWTLEYHVSDLAGETVKVDPADMLHLRGPSWNGYLGMDAVQTAREAIGLAISTEETHASLHANGSQPGGVLSVKGKLDEAARNRLKAQWQAFQGGVANKFKTAVLDMDVDWKPLAMTGVDSQHLETRRFQIEEICRALRVFPQMVMHSDKASTFASAEQFFLAHVTHSLMPWLRRWEEAYGRCLFPNKPNILVRHNVNELLRGDASQRASFYQAALGGARGETAYMTRNEVRAMEDLDPIEGGDKLLIPVVQAPVDKGTDGNAKPGNSPVDNSEEVGKIVAGVIMELKKAGLLDRV